jgi:protein-tyrosine phosphatase
VKVLFVCAGNICRSPFAEGLARRLATERGVDVEFASAGEIALDGDRCPGDAVAAAREHGVDLSLHRARRLTVADRSAVDKVVPLFDVPDPLGRGPAAYRLTYERLREKVEGLLAEVGG